MSDQVSRMILPKIFLFFLLGFARRPLRTLRTISLLLGILPCVASVVVSDLCRVPSPGPSSFPRAGYDHWSCYLVAWGSLVGLNHFGCCLWPLSYVLLIEQSSHAGMCDASYCRSMSSWMDIRRICGLDSGSWCTWRASILSGIAPYHL